MNLLELREPNKVVNSAIDIIEELDDSTTIELMKIEKMSKEEREKIGSEHIINICLLSKQYKRLIKDLEKVRDFASEQLIKVIKERII